MVLDGFLSYAAAAASGSGLIAVARAWFDYRRRRADAPEGARIVVEGAGAAVATLQGVLATMHEELVERDQRIDRLEAKLTEREGELAALRARVTSLETELHVYKGAHP